MVFFKRFSIFIVFSLFFANCRKPSDANWDIDATLPLVNSVLNIQDYLGDTLFSTDASGLLHFVYNNEVASIKLDSLVNLPDTSIVTSFTSTIPVNITLQPGESLALFAPTEIKFNISNGIEIKTATIKSCVMNVKFSNFISQPMDLICEIPSATKNGKKFIIKETIPFGTNTLIKSYDLAGYDLNMRGLNGLQYNTIVQTYTLGLNPGANSVTVAYGDGAKVEVSYSEIVPEYIEGYFGQQTIDVALDTVRFGFSENFQADDFMLSDATMNFKILNEFGAEFSASLYNIKSINTAKPKVVTLQTNQLANININRATKSGTSINPSSKNILFNRTNSNIIDFISNLPDKLTYEGKIQVNPLGNISGHNDFAFYNTGIRIVADIDIPLRYTASNFHLQTTNEVDFSAAEQLDKVNFGSFVVLATNGFPFDVILQAYMYDENKTIIDSLFVPGSNVIGRGTVNAANEVIAATQKNISIPIDKTKIGHLKLCKQIKVVSRLKMPPNPPEIKLYEKYELKVNIIAELNYNVGINN
jgi:hypothetical protein